MGVEVVGVVEATRAPAFGGTGFACLREDDGRVDRGRAEPDTRSVKGAGRCVDRIRNPRTRTAQTEMSVGR